MQGKSFVDEEDSPLEGASPAEIEALAKSVRVSAPAPQLAFGAQWAKGPLEEDPFDVSGCMCAFTPLWKITTEPPHSICLPTSLCTCCCFCRAYALGELCSVHPKNPALAAYDSTEFRLRLLRKDSLCV